MSIRFFDYDLILGSSKWTQEEFPFMKPFKYTDVMRVGNVQGGPPEPTWQDIVISGVGSLTLTKAKADGLNYLKLFGDTEQLPETYIDNVTLDGKCEQDGTPTPTVPIDIVCNNGAIKAKRQSGLPLGYQMVEWLIPTGAIVITGFKTKSTQEITTVFYRESSGSTFLYWSDTSSSGTTNTTAYITSGYGNWRWDGRTLTAQVATQREITSVQSSDGLYFNGEKLGSYTNAGEFVSTNDLSLSSSSNTFVRIFSQTIREGDAVTLDLVPVQRLSDSSYGFYDKVRGEFYTNTEATFVAGDVIDDPVEIYTDGTTETVTDSNQLTATAERLLSVGNYKDTQEVLTGAVTRNIGIKVLDGTENWTTSGNLFYAGIATDALEDTHSCYCTHFKGVATNASASYNNEIKVGTNLTQTVNWTRVQIYPVVGTYSNVTAFKQYLTDQYNAGTPVIVVYPTSSATTETVSGQQLNKEPLTVTGSLTGLVANVVSSTHTTPTPTQPLPINCNNGVVKVNSQGQIYTDGTVETVEVTGVNLANMVSDNIVVNQVIFDSGNIGNSPNNYYYLPYIPIRPNTSYVLYGRAKSDNTLSAYNRICWYDKNQNFISRASYTVNTIGKATSPANAYYARFAVSCFNSTSAVTLEQILSFNWTFAQATQEIPYEPYFNGGTATAEMLLKVGDYQDVQSVLDGVVTRNVGVKVLDGTENDYAKRSDYAINYTGLTGRVYGVGIYGMCSHFICSASNASTAPVGSLFFNISNNYLHFFTEYGGDVTSFKQWLADQYANGTPVIVVYPLAEPTTETVTGQPLTIQAGTNVVEITQASMDNLELEVGYKQRVDN